MKKEFESGITFVHRIYNPEVKHDVPGVQIGFDNGYGISILASQVNLQNPNFIYDNATVGVIRVSEKILTGEPCTLDIMEALSYRPSFDEMREQLFYSASSYMIAKIIRHISQIGVQ